MGHTYQHPHRKPDPGALVQLHHEIDIHEDAQHGKDWQERHLRRHKAAASALAAERGAGTCLHHLTELPRKHPAPDADMDLGDLHELPSLYREEEVSASPSPAPQFLQRKYTPMQANLTGLSN